MNGIIRLKLIEIFFLKNESIMLKLINSNNNKKNQF